MKSSSLKRRLCGHCQTNIRVEEGGGVITVGVTRPDHLGKTHALRIGVHYRPLRNLFSVHLPTLHFLLPYMYDFGSSTL